MCSQILVILSYTLIVITFPLSICYCLRVVQEYERCVIFRLGRNRTDGPRGPGLFFILPCIDSLIKLDLRTVTFDVPPQEILTKDSVTITVDAVVYFKLFDPVLSVNRVADSQFSTRLLAATTLRNILGTKTLQEILQDKESLSQNMQRILDAATNDWFDSICLDYFENFMHPDHSLNFLQENIFEIKIFNSDSFDFKFVCL